MQERLWMNQQRMQEVHRRRLYHRSSSHHTLVFRYIYILFWAKVPLFINQTLLLVRDHVTLTCIHRRNILVEREEIVVPRILDAIMEQITRRIQKIISHLPFYHRHSNLLFTVILRLEGHLVSIGDHALCCL